MMRALSVAGFSLVELLVTIAITLAAVGAIFQLAYPAQLIFQAEPERADMQQRLRIAAETMSRDLMMAGAGGEQAGSAVPLGRVLAAIQPLRRGLRSPDVPGSFFDDRISMMYVPHAAAQTILIQPTPSTAVVAVAPQAGCPVSNPLCGFKANQLIVVYDETGSYDTFRLLAVQDNPPVLSGDGAPLSKTFEAGAIVAELKAATYWLRNDARANLYQLMQYDGQQTDSPVADNVFGLRFEYLGEPKPPAIIRALDAEHGPWTTYGPKPPLAGIDDPSTPGYGAGENCVFTVDHLTTIARPEMVDLGSVAGEMVRLDPAILHDGPWCPDSASPVRYDADLLRIRRVRVAIRLRAARTLIHTPLPDFAVSIDVGVRNLSR